MFDALEKSCGNFLLPGSCQGSHGAKTELTVSETGQGNSASGQFVTGDALTEHVSENADRYPVETVVIVKAGGPLGLSIVGGTDHPSHPFGVGDPGIFVSKIVSDGAAAKTSLRIGDRILSVNGKDIRRASHSEAVNSLTSQAFEILLEVRHDPQPPGLQEIKLYKEPGERLGISIRGGTKCKGGNPLDKTDEGIFIARIEPNGAIARDGRLKVGQRILEVNRQSLLGVSHQEAVQSLLGVKDKLVMLVCDGFDAALILSRSPSSPLTNQDHISDCSSQTLQNVPLDSSAILTASRIASAKPTPDADLIRKEILAFEAKRKFFEKENESVPPSKADSIEVNRNAERNVDRGEISIRINEPKQLSTISTGNNTVNIGS